VSSRRRIGLVLGFYLAVMAVLAGAFVLSRPRPIDGVDPSVIPTINPSALPTVPLPSLAPVGSPQEVVERPPSPAIGACTVTIPSSVTKVNGNGRYRWLAPGDVICLAAGERDNIKFFNLHGAASNPIVIRNEGGVVRIVGNTNKLGGIGLLRTSAIRVTGTGVSEACGAQYQPDAQECGIVIANAFNGVRVAPDGSPRRIEIDHLRVQGTSTLNHSTGISIHPEPGQTISGFYVHHNYLVDIYREGMYIGSEPHANRFETLGKLANVDISYNLVQRTGYDGIKVKVAVRNVSVHDNRVISPALAEFAKHETGIQLATSSADVYNNIVRGGVEGIASGRPMPSPVCRYFNNVVIGPSAEGFITSEDGALIYSNTVIGSGAAGIWAKGNDSQVFDNIVSGSVGTPVTGPNSVVDLNNLVGPMASIGFIAPVRGDLRLKPDSPAIDRGAVSGVYPPFDVVRSWRPYGSRPDIGAYEYWPPS
jgi:hypothetical protein